MRPFAIIAPVVIGAVLLSSCLVGPRSCEAAESASSHYLPGLTGDIFMARPPQPGLLIANTVYAQSGDASTAVLQGLIEVGIELDLVLNFLSASYTIEDIVLGGSFTAGVAVPTGYANLALSASGPLGRTVGTEAEAVELADLILTPVQLNWWFDDLSVKLAEVIIVPTGSYDDDNLVNLGRNYWSFDTLVAVTWFNADTGTEISAAPGIMFNTTNNATNYQTGTEFHIDFAVNQFLDPNFAFGLRGYYYNQLTRDSGSGAILGDFKGEALALGAGFFWTPDPAQGRLVLTAKFMHDIFATNRIDSHYGTVGLAWKL